MSLTGRQAEHVQPHYLAAHGVSNAEIPSFDDLGLGPAVQVAARYSDIRSKMDLTVTSPDISVPVAADPWREVSGLFGSVGESLAVTIPCEVEVELHRRARQNGDLPGSMMVAERFFAESQAQKVIELAHRTINLGFRSLGLRPEWKQRIVSRKKYAPLVEEPFSTDRKAWITFTEGATDVLGRIGRDVCHPSAEALGSALREFARSDSYTALEEQRGQDFHRWRLESPVLAGVDATSSLIVDVHDTSGQVIGKSMGTGSRIYAAGDGIVERIADTAGAALRRLVPALDDFADAFLALVEPASRGVYSWSDEKQVFSHHVRDWDDVNCTCCTAAT